MFPLNGPNLFPLGILLACVCSLTDVTAQDASDEAAPVQWVATVSSVELPETISFNAHIRPIMSGTCFACHGPDAEENESEFRIDSFDAATSPLPSDDSMRGIVAGDPAASEVFLRITGQSDGEEMPPAHFRHHLSDYDKALLGKWIQQGAKYEQHWSYAPILAASIPKLKTHQDKVVNEIDSFVIDRLESEGLQPSDTADPDKLVRRLHLDLLGLPPTPAQVQSFVANPTDAQYRKRVDELLASKHFGERMASSWLDLVRYADTVGFHGDQNLRDFPYRDYVIDSFNQNKPFDEFTRQQIAGDLKPDPTPEDLIATGVLRLNMVTREGGAQPGEYLAKYKADRVRMLGTAWLGSTLACCECHNHKYDPFSAKDFYSLGAFFDDIRQWGVYSDYGYTPNKDLKGFNNEFPFPPEIRVASDSAKREILALQAERDRKLFEKLGQRTLASEPLEAWTESVRELLERHPSGWVDVQVTDHSADGDTKTKRLDDQSVLMSGPVGQSGDQIRLTAKVDQPLVANSIRLEVLPDPSHGDRVGRSADGRFTAEVSVKIVTAEQAEQSGKVANEPRFIRVELPGKNKTLSLCELQVFGRPADADDESTEIRNVAPEGVASQSSQHAELTADRAIDGNTETDAQKGRSLSHTLASTQPWWELDLKKPHAVERIVIFNRTDGDYAKRLKGYELVFLDSERRELYRTKPQFPSPKVEITAPTEVVRSTVQPTPIGWAQVDRQNPTKYRSGDHASKLSGPWRSGPAAWQLPADETKLTHTGVFHFMAPVELEPDSTIVVTITSSDIGRVRLSVSPLADAQPGWDAADADFLAALRTPADERTEQHHAALVSAFHRSMTASMIQAPEAKTYRDAILDLDAAMAMSVVVQSIDDEQLPISRIRPRGNWQDESGELAPPAVPHFLPQPDRSSDRRLTRMDLADWLTSAQNPLVARHFVNRTWKHFFGAGLSGKLDDLGSQGEWPSHPLLLDHLASDFIANDWNVKDLIRKLVTSHTYRQSAAKRSDLAELDPYNRLLGQASPRRLEAEVIRDNALAIAGLLNDRYVGGPSVYPYQPDGHYSNLQFPNRKYTDSADGRQYRRGVYMHWQRTFLHPMLVNFDAPSRDECAADRLPSNSPQQALTLLNDPTFAEAAHVMAANLVSAIPSGSFDDRLDEAMMRAVARTPTDEEREALAGLFERQLAYFRDHQDEAVAFNRVGNSDSNRSQTGAAELAALGQVCRVILNLHETITRY